MISWEYFENGKWNKIEDKNVEKHYMDYLNNNDQSGYMYSLKHGGISFERMETVCYISRPSCNCVSVKVRRIHE